MALLEQLNLTIDWKPINQLLDSSYPTGKCAEGGNEHQMRIVEEALRSHPSQHGLEGNLWDGKMLSHFIKKQFNTELGVRQCQRLFRRLGFRLRKPRPLIAKADPEKQQDFKKNC